jgi:hypothetical protein
MIISIGGGLRKAPSAAGSAAANGFVLISHSPGFMKKRVISM